MSDIWVIKDSETDMWLTVPSSASPEESEWSEEYAEHFTSEGMANSVISGWGYTPGQRYIGSNPPTPPPKPPL